MIRPGDIRANMRRFAAAQSGTALIEFAIVLPVMLTLYLGGFEISDAIACNRRVTVTARSTADLTSQYVSVTKSQLDTILGASAQVMYPYSTSSALVRVSEITVDQYNRPLVTWSRAINGAGRTPGSAFALPPIITYAGLSFIVSEVSYTYTPMIRVGMLKPVVLTQTISLMPRVSSTVPCTDCATP